MRSLLLLFLLSSLTSFELMGCTKDEHARREPTYRNSEKPATTTKSQSSENPNILIRLDEEIERDREEINKQLTQAEFVKDSLTNKLNLTLSPEQQAILSAAAKPLEEAVAEAYKVIPKEEVDAYVTSRLNAGHEDAHAKALARYLDKQTEKEKPPDLELEKIRLLAEQGNPIGQVGLGLRYWEGEGVPKNRNTAILWIKRAAEQDYIEGQYLLGLIYNVSQDNLQDAQEAVYWIQLAAQKGHPGAQYYLGRFYAFGLKNLPKDYMRASCGST